MSGMGRKGPFIPLERSLPVVPLTVLWVSSPRFCLSITPLQQPQRGRAGARLQLPFRDNELSGSGFWWVLRSRFSLFQFSPCSVRPWGPGRDPLSRGASPRRVAIAP